MEQSPESIFDLEIDAASNQNLIDAARWGKFLAIAGFVILGLVIIVALFMGASVSSLRGGSSFGLLSGISVLIIYLAMALLGFFPCLYLYRFSSRMQQALRMNDQESLTNSFANLKFYFRFVGILTIIVIAIYLIAILLIIVGAASRGF